MRVLTVWNRDSGFLSVIYLLLLTIIPSQIFAREVRVGIYENYPKVFTTDDGIPSGIFVDILESIADEEGWDLRYVHGSWSECLEWLESAEIDLMMDVAFSETRDEVYDFCENNVISNWAQVYTRNDLEIDLLTDLDSMRIATMRRGIHLTRFKALLDGFSMYCEIVLVDDYETVFSLLDAGEADAGVVNRVFGYANADRYDVTRSPVVFSPASLRYAVKADCNIDLISAIDRHLNIMKEDQGSIYHQTLRKWLGETSKFTMPERVRLTLYAIGVIAALFFIMSIILRRQVKRKTHVLRKTNLELSEQVKKTMKAHLDLKHSEEIRIHQERLSALGQMVFGIAHDFNNMLTPILGYSDLMMESHRSVNGQANQLDYLQIIRNAAEDARETVKRLQESMQADTRTRMESVSVHELISEVVESVQPALRSIPEDISRPVSINQDVSDDLVITACRNQLKNALLNLLINSIHAVSSGDEIKIKAFAGSDMATLEVIDTGKGMSKDVLRQCTEPFFTTKGSQGTGMGLAMVYGIVKRHNGELTVESSQGSGTTVTVSLPLTQDMSGETEMEISSLPVKPMKILLIDDDICSLKLISEHLKHDNHSVTAFENSEEAAAVYRSGDFDMVITDMAMPDATGAEVAQRVKSITPEIPVLMITGFAQLLAGREVYPRGIDCIIGKPFTLEEIRTGIRKACGRCGNSSGRQPDNH